LKFQVTLKVVIILLANRLINGNWGIFLRYKAAGV
jgi:hypothetical protein